MHKKFQLIFALALLLTTGAFAQEQSSRLLKAEATDQTVSSKSGNSDYRIYPNPAGNKLNIELLSSSNNNSDIDIYDSSLRLYENYRVEGSQSNLTVSTAEWSNGIYFVIITHHITQQTVIQRVVIKHRQDSGD